MFKYLLIHAFLWVSGLSLAVSVLTGKWYAYSSVSVQATFGGKIAAKLMGDWGIGYWKYLLGIGAVLVVMGGLTYLVTRDSNNHDAVLASVLSVPLGIFIAILHGPIAIFSDNALMVLYARLLNFNIQIDDFFGIYFMAVIVFIWGLGVRALVNNGCSVVYALFLSTLFLIPALIVSLITIKIYWVGWAAFFVYMKIVPTTAVESP